MRAAEGGRWHDRRVLAWLLRAGIVLSPVLAAVVVVRVADAAFSPRAWSLWQELLLMTPLALVAGLATERALRRFLPLAMLLRMDMLFPGRAPSRFAIARRARSRDQLMAMLADRDAGPQQAAQAMMALLAALAGHDRRTRGHSERTRVLADVLSSELKLSQHDRDRLRWAALLHDIGKLEIAPQLLNKPSALDESEWTRMKQHPVHGAQLTSALTGWLGPWADGILHHHEKFDGSGYPAGLAGEEISLAGRVISVVDAYESMTAARPYQKARATRAARMELVRCAGTHFDPAVVRAFLSISLPRLLWATGALGLLAHLPYLRELQTVGQQVTTVAGSQVATAAGVTAMVVSASAVPAWSAHDHVHPAPAQQVVAASPVVAEPSLVPTPEHDGGGAIGSDRPAVGDGAVQDVPPASGPTAVPVTADPAPVEPAVPTTTGAAGEDGVPEPAAVEDAPDDAQAPPVVANPSGTSGSSGKGSSSGKGGDGGKGATKAEEKAAKDAEKAAKDAAKKAEDAAKKAAKAAEDAAKDAAKKAEDAKKDAAKKAEDAEKAAKKAAEDAARAAKQLVDDALGSALGGVDQD